MLILFDYGHGGKDPGATYKGRQEAQDVLKIGQAVAKRLRIAGVTVDETRTTDTTLSLDERVKIEFKKKYDYFISFHRNAFKPEQATGAEVFVYSLADWNKKAHALAAAIQKALVTVGFHNRGVKQAAYYVLKHTKAPAILLEIGFIDNSHDNQLFDTQLEQLVNGIAHAILKITGVAVKSSVCATCGRAL